MTLRNDAAKRQLQMRVQVEWESVMDIFFERMDNITRRPELTDEDVIAAIGISIDEDTADRYQEWIDE